MSSPLLNEKAVRAATQAFVGPTTEQDMREALEVFLDAQDPVELGNWLADHLKHRARAGAAGPGTFEWVAAALVRP